MWDAPSVYCIIVTPTLKVTLLRLRTASVRAAAPVSVAAAVVAATAEVAPVEAATTTITTSAVAAPVVSNLRPSDGSDWPSSHWSYLVSGATYLYVPATGVECSADVAANLTKQLELQRFVASQTARHDAWWMLSQLQKMEKIQLI